MCFVVAKEGGKGDGLYEPLVQKCAEYLVDLEKVHASLLTYKTLKLGIKRVNYCMRYYTIKTSFTSSTLMYIK